MTSSMRTRTFSREFAPDLRVAIERSGMSLMELILAAGLDITEPSMLRKLQGIQGIGVDSGEAEALAKVFGLRVTWTPRAGFRLAKRAA